MPNKSCTIILNGHGKFIPHQIVNMGLMPTDYNLIFPCGYKESISPSHHNLILSDLVFLPNDKIVQRLEIIEKLETTYITSKKATTNLVTDIVTSRYTSIACEHILSDAPDVLKAHSLSHFNAATNPPGRFIERELSTIPDHAQPRQWGQGNLYIEFDIKSIEADVIANIGSNASTLSANNLLYMQPIAIAPAGSQATFKLSELISDILPKIKFFASKHTNNSVEVLPYVFLDDRNDSALNLKDCQTYFPKIFGANDSLHELTIAGDANILWDACRDIVI